MLPDDSATPDSQDRTTIDIHIKRGHSSHPFLSNVKGEEALEELKPQTLLPRLERWQVASSKSFEGSLDKVVALILGDLRIVRAVLRNEAWKKVTRSKD